MMPVLLAAGFALSAWMGWQLALVVAGYFLLTTAYSFVLKQRIGVDICALAILYTLRIVAGGAATGITLSVWLLAFSFFFFFSLAALKRQIELVDMVKRNETRARGRGYSVEDSVRCRPSCFAMCPCCPCAVWPPSRSSSIRSRGTMGVCAILSLVYQNRHSREPWDDA